MNTIRELIRDIPDFPKPGIVYKDITPILKDSAAMKKVIAWFAETARKHQVDVIVGVDARGFIFGSAAAYELGLGFVPVRKMGKLPYETLQHSYSLEYGEATLEIHKDAVHAGQRVAIVDDLLATGGTAAAAGQLVSKLGAEVSAYLFLIELSFLEGKKGLNSAVESAIVVD